MRWISRVWPIWIVALLAATWAIYEALRGVPITPPSAQQRRVIVLGFDGLDPLLLDRYMGEARLPNFQAFAARGHYQRLATTEPAQSPVAWASFATGTHAGAHGIFDFLHREFPGNTPKFSIVSAQPPETIALGDMLLPYTAGKLLGTRRGESLWMAAERLGVRASVMRVPVTYPPDPISHLIAGMGVPDLLGTQGTYTLIANHLVPEAEAGGQVIMRRADEAGTMALSIPGPAHPLFPKTPLELPIRISQADGATAAQISIPAGNPPIINLRPGEWSDWVVAKFPFLGVGSVSGMVRFHLASGLPRLRLYVSPIHIDPENPATPISSPPAAAGALARQIGRFHTLGMPEETWAFNAGHIDESAWLDTVRATLREGEAMFNERLQRRTESLVVKVFVQPDRVSHMFWRGIDPQHPGYANASPLARGAIAWIYEEADRILGNTLKQLSATDELIVMSDHGFASFRRAVHLNRFLVDQGLMKLRPGAAESAPLFADVDWTQTRAYALGLNSVFVNKVGREATGIVPANRVGAVKAEISQKLLAWRDRSGAPVLKNVHDALALYPANVAERDPYEPDLVMGYAAGYRASWQTTLGAVPSLLIEDNHQHWSGDHCIDSALVPGVFLSSRRIERPIVSILDLRQLILDRLSAP